jgi:hypothetical protein
VPPQVRFSSGETLPFVKRTIGGTNFYLLTNPSDKTVKTTVEFAERRTAEIWDPWTGQTAVVSSRRSAAGESLDVTLPPDGSQLVAFTAARGAPRAIWQQTRQQEVGSTGWSVEAAGNSEKGAGVTLHVNMPRLVDWLEQPELRTFSGNATYTTHVTLAAGDLRSGRILLDLGNVEDAALVKVNGVFAGMAIVPPFALEIKSLLHAGDNKLEITVANTLTNYVSSLKGSAVSGYQSGHFEPLSSGLLGPVLLRYESSLSPKRAK